ncbi:MAG: ABC transporter substrate-binding protein [Rhodospirillaceae bacterium]|jgi:microcin C transport system substrate-binding protein|nr:ABC transporter substrate-binding protein [Rhodospirillaceae bacterium]MBT4689115.1 ABC transporter substrate-binding protein [Rhodospirillaceae bacterium]MBT5079718.1 ABC transporter substrate-binding protein [Rhodospirillaceae bacterium]MBT5527279.1 ABC transporter substrate-binding protein [Rhodospirillaceae bacterium]MBT5880318.1 ABC transporter substrate-binding protein [Rhodospirillaceae bacterium]
MRVLLLTLGCLFLSLPALADGAARHGMSMFGELKYPSNFKHFEYVNPDAPKGGLVRMEARGTYDTLNGFTIKGSAAAGLGLIYDTLMESARDEAFAEYGLLVRSVVVADDLSSVTFDLRKAARWHDGKPITADDVVFSLDLLKAKGAPFYRFYYANVDKAEALSPHKVKFTFKGRKNRELPLIIGQLPVLPKHYWQDKEFEATTLAAPLGSGPYRIVKVDPGRSITYERVSDYWGRDLAVNKGRHNFDTLRFEYYRDPTVALEAFKANAFDFRQENTAKVWATSYTFPALKKGHVIKETLANGSPTGMQSFAFNTRRAKFQDPRVRQALALAFDFEWANKNLFFGQYTRTQSYFSNSELASTGLPSPLELKLLEPLKGQIPGEVFTKTFQAPKTDGSGKSRTQLRQAKRLLTAAGWTIKDGQLTHGKTGEVMTIEFLLLSQAFQRIVAPMQQSMKRLGITANIRLVDTSQYVNRLRDFDFDIIGAGWGQSLSPGNEQRDFWGAEAADRPGSRNYIGIKDPAIDKLIDHIIFAGSRDELVAASRALDRVLLWNHFVIPNWHINSYRIAYWNRFARPAIKPKYGLGFTDTWWVDNAKDKALQMSLKGGK